MTERRPDAAATSVVDHKQRSVARLPHGGFILEVAGVPAARVVPTGTGWRIEGDPEMQGWSLRRAGSGAGFVVSHDERELGRTMIACGMEGTTAPRNLLLEDGRLFRILPSGPREAGMDLLSWEVPGAYLRARPESRGFKLLPTVAASGLTDVRVLSLLFAAEVLDAEEPLLGTTSS